MAASPVTSEDNSVPTAVGGQRVKRASSAHAVAYLGLCGSGGLWVQCVYAVEQGGSVRLHALPSAARFSPHV